MPGGGTLLLGARTLVMGILNVTPDSFAGGGAPRDTHSAVRDGLRMVEEGADILDVGGESTRPGATPVSADEELRRVMPVIEGLRSRTATPLSIDTYKAVVADRALEAGAEIVNDVSGLTYDTGLGAVIARRGAAAVLMHTRGRSTEMYSRAQYGSIGADVARELGEVLARAAAAGIPAGQVVLDPGFGFAKRAPQTFRLLADLSPIRALGRPLLVGPSRKSFLKLALGDVAPEGRLWGTAAAVTASVLGGAHIVRVHDIAEMRQVVKVADAILDNLSNQ